MTDLLSRVRAAIAEPDLYTERGTGDDALPHFRQARAAMVVFTAAVADGYAGRVIAAAEGRAEEASKALFEQSAQLAAAEEEIRLLRSRLAAVDRIDATAGVR